MRLFISAGLASLVACSSSPGSPIQPEVDTQAGITTRASDAVVLLGSQLPLSAYAPADIVAFARHSEAWVQIPVQVDERERVDFCQVYAKALFAPGLSPCGTTEVIQFLAYSDPSTYTGRDSDATFDSDDELVFMARDSGSRTTAPAPDGAIAESLVEVALGADGASGYVYLFARADASLSPGAGKDYVTYTQRYATPIDYLTGYPFRGDGSCGDKVCDPPILEDSTVQTSRYSRHFSARWVTDGLQIVGDGSSGQNILDIAQSRFSPSSCGRHVLTFSTAEGAFIANIDGPVRAIRSYLGANSGPVTERTHLFYDTQEIVQTSLRVHGIPGIMDLVDYAPSATGMTYANSANPSGFAIDGVPDSGFDPSLPAWELVTGPHGSMIRILHLDTSMPTTPHGYYEDNAATTNDQCSASNTLTHPDNIAFGTSGVFVDSAISDTDPRNGSLDHLYIEARQIYIGEAIVSEDASAIATAASITVTGVTAAPDGSCGDSYCSVTENSISCALDCSTKPVGGSICGNLTCEVDEHELSCATDCWGADDVQLVECMANHCSGEKGACSDEIVCVDLVVCVIDCEDAGGAQSTCQTQCANANPATAEQRNFALALLSCSSAACQ